MNEEFRVAIEALQKARQDASLKPVPFADLREQLLATALRAMAAGFGVRLEGALHINANGEFKLVAQGDRQPAAWYGTGVFGEPFARELTQYRARTGFPGPNKLIGENGWCYLGHMDAERMVMAYYDRHRMLESHSSVLRHRYVH